MLVALAFFYEGPLKEWKDNFGQPRNFLAGLEVDQISRVEIDNENDSIALEREGERWKIVGTKTFYIKDDIINTVISALKEAVKAEVEVVSENFEKKPDFKTDDVTGAKISLRQADVVLAELIVGKTGSDFTSTYISRSDIDKTFLIKANLKSALVHNDWYDREIFNSAQDQITRIRFQYQNSEFTIAKDTEADPNATFGQWAGVEPYEFRVDDEKAQIVLEIMSTLSAVSVPVQDFANTGLEKNLIIVQAFGEGIDNVLMVGDANEDGLYYVKRGDSDNIYLITKEQRDELDKQIRDLR